MTSRRNAWPGMASRALHAARYMSKAPDRSLPRRADMKAVIIAPADPGEGGLGTAARDMAEGLAGMEMDVEFIGRAPDTFVRQVAAKRPLRTFPGLLRELDRRAVLARV